MLLNPNTSTPGMRLGNTGALLGLPGHRLTGRLLKASLGCAVAWFAYQVGNQIVSSQSRLQPSPAATISFLTLALTVVAYAAMRQQAQLAEQKRAQSARDLGAEMDRAGLAGAIEEASDAVVITDAEGVIQYVNPAYTSMTGYSAAEVVGRNPRQDPDPRPAFYQQVMETVRTGKVWRGEVANRRKDGSSYIEDITVAPVRDAGGAIRRYIAIRRDMTVHNAANEAKAFLASIVESSQDAILSSTPDGVILSWNRGAARLYGYGAEEIVGKPVSILAPADQRANLKWIGERLQRGESVGQFEGVGLAKDGQRVDISISACPIRNAEGQITALASIMRDITARVQAQEARALLASIVDSADDAIFGAALDGAILSWNKGAERMYGYCAPEILGKTVSILQPTPAAAGGTGEATQLLERIGRGETISQLETVTVSREGRRIEVSLTMSPVRNAAGEVVGSSTIARDIASRRRNQEALRQSEEKYRWLLANLPDVVLVADETGRPVFVSSNCEGLSGYTPEEICQTGFWVNRIHREDQARVEAAFHALFDKGSPVDIEYRFLKKDGQWAWLHSRAVNVYERDGKRYRDGLISDITERKRMEQRLAHQATHDLLTGLPNRNVLEDRFRQALARAHRQGGMVALLYLDLDRFKRINDTLGHRAGDTLIQLAAARLAGCVRESETLSRGSGDRFMLVLSDVAEPQDAVNVAERILEILSPPFAVKGNEVFLGASIGIALYPQDGEDPLVLQRAADSALYAAKRQGKRRIQLSSPEISQEANRRLAIETELHHALERDEISVHYQPQFDLASGCVAGLEALVRWENPKFGRVPASVLIPIAEESGLIVPIGSRVLRDACRQARVWRDAGYGPIQVAVNTSAVQFARGDLAETVAATLAETGLEAWRLDLEVTESVIMQDIRETARQLRELKKLGVSVSLDDFGTGYSSLSYLEELPIDNLKIDRKFVQRMNSADNTRTLVQSIVGLAHGLGMRAVAEGVETGEQLEQLKAMGCDRAQSFMLAGPAPALCIQALLAARGGACNPAQNAA
jgi:diguanylate cyclase (GGDEF)-like protein/PAS domain S-box-containing protein